MRHKQQKWVPAVEKLAKACAELEKIRAVIKALPKALEERNKKLADIQPLLDRVGKEWGDKTYGPCKYECERKKAAIIEDAKNRQGWLDKLWGVDPLLGYNPITIELKKKIKEMEFAVYRKARQEYEAETKKIFIAKESEQTIEDKWYDGLRAIDTMGHGPQSEDADLNRMYAYYYGSIEHHLSFDGYYFCDFGLKLAALDENRKLQEIEQLKKLAEQETEEGKLRLKYGIGDDVFAAAAAHFGTTRQLADKIKGALEGQLAVTKDCPYCGLPLGDAMHADHIYPVFKGGLSTIENMVLICDQCNLKKGSKTLRQFIAAYKLDGKRIELVLESLGKHF